MQNPFDKYLSPEDHLHIACCNWLRIQYPNLLWHHSPNEGKRSAFERYKFSLLGAKGGFPDLVIFQVAHGHSGLAVEFKKPKTDRSAKGKVSDNQKNWLERLEKAGWLTAVIYDFDSFEILVSDYLK